METIIAMPSICDSTDFGLPNPKINRKYIDDAFREPTLKKLKEVEPGLTLYHWGNPARSGAYLVIDEQLTILVYYMEYKVSHKALVGTSSVTQTQVWRAKHAGLPEGFVQNFMMSVLLHKYPAVMSDKTQTKEGRNLWMDLLTRAIRRGMKVALANFEKNDLHEIVNLEDLQLLSKSAWAKSSIAHQSLRFIIYAK